MTNAANKLSEKALMSSDISNIITRQSVEFSQINYKSENRPCVFPMTPDTHRYWGTLVARIPFINSGKTPARKFCMVIKFGRSDKIWVDPRSFEYTNSKWEKILFPAYPDTEIIKSTIWKPDPHSRIYLFGKIWYSDTWDSLHSTTFAWEWESFRGGFARLPEYESAN
jgi:hypothetical protein